MRPKDPGVHTVRFLVRSLFRVLGGYHVYGKENLPRSGAAILAPNHLSWADPPAVRVTIRRLTWFMAGDFLFKIPILSSLIRFFDAFPVNQERVDREAIRKAEACLKQGDLLCVFPEGATSPTGRLMSFEGGVALLALRNDVPVIPVGIWGTEKVLPNDNRYPHFARGGVSVRFGPPIFPADIDPSLPRKERMDELTRRMFHAVAELLPPEYRPAPEQPPLVEAPGADKTPSQ